ncbi:hypothetical protein HanIR_Chr12g0577441 [Helianthus annuus]|nr:hypothetical protein HanIR_Chr12g0577441 [Helianthus annuus]
MFGSTREYSGRVTRVQVHMYDTIFRFRLDTPAREHDPFSTPITNKWVKWVESSPIIIHKLF